MNQILYSKNAQKTKGVVLILVIVLLLLVLGFFVLGLMNARSNKFTKGVVINSIEVGNMTMDEARLALDKQQKAFDQKVYLLNYKNREVAISGDEIDLEYSGDFLLTAYQYGKSTNFLENSIIALKGLLNVPYLFESDLVLNENVLKEKVDVLLEEEKATAVDDSYEISGDKILVTKGHDGVVAKIEPLKATILENATTTQTDIKVMLETDVQVAERIDFTTLYNEVFVERKNASYEQNQNGEPEFVKELLEFLFIRLLLKMIILI